MSINFISQINFWVNHDWIKDLKFIISRINLDQLVANMMTITKSTYILFNDFHIYIYSKRIWSTNYICTVDSLRIWKEYIDPLIELRVYQLKRILDVRYAHTFYIFSDLTYNYILDILRYCCTIINICKLEYSRCKLFVSMHVIWEAIRTQ